MDNQESDPPGEAGTKRHAGGRPRSAMTDAAIEEILQTVRLGIWPDTAARRHGVNPSTLRSLRQSNEEFRTAIDSAEAEAEIGFHGRIVRAASGTPPLVDDAGKVIGAGIRPNWRSAAWILERRWPARYALQPAPAIGELNVADGAKVEITPGPPLPTAGEWGPYVEKLAEVTAALDEAAAKRGTGNNGDTPVLRHDSDD